MDEIDHRFESDACVNPLRGQHSVDDLLRSLLPEIDRVAISARVEHARTVEDPRAQSAARGVGEPTEGAGT